MAAVDRGLKVIMNHITDLNLAMAAVDEENDLLRKEMRAVKQAILSGHFTQAAELVRAWSFDDHLSAERSTDETDAR